MDLVNARSLVLALVLAVAGPAAGQSPAPASPSPSAAGPDAATQAVSPKLQAAAKKALLLVKEKQYKPALKLLDQVLDRDPAYTRARLLRARILLKVRRFDEAVADAEQVVKESPSLEGARAFLEKATAEKKANVVVYNDKSAGYSEWDRVWTIPGKTPFTLKEFKGAEGYTVFYAAARPGNRDEIEPYMVDANDQQLYFLRVIDLRGTSGRVDVTLPAATALKIPRAPYLIILDPKGAELSRGEPDALAKDLDKVRTEAKSLKKAGNVELVSSQDFSQSGDSIESLAVKGYTTVVMVTSPG